MILTLYEKFKKIIVRIENSLMRNLGSLTELSGLIKNSDNFIISVEIKKTKGKDIFN